MGVTCVNARISIGQNNTVRVTGCTTNPVASVRTGELSWKEQAVDVEEETSVITHTNLKRPIKSIIWVDGAPMNWAKSGITRTYTYDDAGAKTSGTFTFPEGIAVNDQLIFEYK